MQEPIYYIYKKKLSYIERHASMENFVYQTMHAPRFLLMIESQKS